VILPTQLNVDVDVDVDVDVEMKCSKYYSSITNFSLYYEVSVPQALLNKLKSIKNVDISHDCMLQQNSTFAHDSLQLFKGNCCFSYPKSRFLVILANLYNLYQYK